MGKVLSKMQGINENELANRPRLLLAYTDSLHASRCARQLRRQGWEVHLAASGAEVHRLVRDTTPDVVVLDTELQDRNGWLTAAKVFSRCRVVLVSPDAEFIPGEWYDALGADAVVPRSDNIEGLLEVLDGQLAAAF